MGTDIMNERLTVKDIIFTKALPNYKIPVPTDGYKVFSCTDCGDKFLFESSYEYHINRKSLKISYFCRHCVMVIIFYNRCKLLSHIRCHAFKSATITITDLKIEPLPLENFDLTILTRSQNKPENYTIKQKSNVCYECNQNIDKLGVIFKDRAAHYMQVTMESHSCPICMFLLPTVCGLEAHLRIHLNIPPFFCPECGLHLQKRAVSYPYEHDCEGFKMMKSAIRSSCKFDNCAKLFHPNDYRTHFKSHVKKVYRCSYCLEIWYNENQTTCLLCKNSNISSYIQCPRCPNKLFAESLIERHLNSHCTNFRDKLNDQIYPCTNCNVVFKQMNNLINHHVKTHSSGSLKRFLSKFSVKSDRPARYRKHVYHRVIKKCSKCSRSFTYRCLYENIKKLPIDCPFRCTTNSGSTSQSNHNLQMECFLCKRIISQNWIEIKAHYAEFHKNHKCLDIQVLVTQLDPQFPQKKSYSSALVKNKIKKTKVQVNNSAIVARNKEKDVTSNILNESNVCIICRYISESRQNLEIHMMTHRDPCMAYQCLECGKSFVVKPSFSTHLLLEHGISDVQEYIAKKPCYNELALLKDQDDLKTPIEEPVKENQCKVCRVQFEDYSSLEKHFRVHGMAFLMKNACRNSTSP